MAKAAKSKPRTHINLKASDGRIASDTYAKKNPNKVEAVKIHRKKK